MAVEGPELARNVDVAVTEPEVAGLRVVPEGVEEDVLRRCKLFDVNPPDCNADDRDRSGFVGSVVVIVTGPSRHDTRSPPARRGLTR